MTEFRVEKKKSSSTIGEVLVLLTSSCWRCARLRHDLCVRFSDTAIQSPMQRKLLCPNCMKWPKILKK